MTPQVRSNHYRVGWKFENRKAEVADYAFPTLSELMIHLKKSEGITSINVEELYVHHIKPDGNIVELVSFDNKEPKDHSSTERPAVRARASRTVRRNQLTQAMVVGPLAPTAADRDDCEIPWPATGMFDNDRYYDSYYDDEEQFLNKITQVITKYKMLREKPRATGTPISEAMYTAHPAVTTE